jgi:hypothetical protein
MSVSDSIGRGQDARRANTDQKTAAPKTIQHMVPMEMFAVEIGDENGRRKRVLAFRVGNTWFHDPSAEPWFDRLKQIDAKTWLAKSLEERFQSVNAPVSVPKEDTVDILGGGE